MDQEDPDGPDPRVIQCRSSPVALPFHNHNHNFDLKKDRVDRGDYLKSLRPGERVDTVAVHRLLLLLFIFVHWWQPTFRLTGEGKPAVLNMSAEFLRTIKIKMEMDVDKDKNKDTDTENIAQAG